VNSLTGGFFRLLSSPAVQHPEGFQRLFAWRALRQSLVGGANGSGCNHHELQGAISTRRSQSFRGIAL